MQVLYTVADAAKIMGVSKSTVDRMIADREIAVYRRGGITRIHTDEINRHIADHTTPAVDDAPAVAA